MKPRSYFRFGNLWPVLGLVLASPSFAFPWPSPWRSTVPDHLTLVGRGLTGADTSYPFTVVVRNSDGSTMAYLHVTLEFGSLDLRICSDQGPGFTVDCPARTIYGLSDAQGVVTFCVMGCARNNAGAAPETKDWATVRADGFVLKTGITVAVPDQLYCDGLNGNDLYALLGDILSGVYFMRSDYDRDGSLGGNDLSLWLGMFFSGTSADGCWNATCGGP